MNAYYSAYYAQLKELQTPASGSTQGAAAAADEAVAAASRSQRAPPSPSPPPRPPSSPSPVRSRRQPAKPPAGDDSDPEVDISELLDEALEKGNDAILPKKRSVSRNQRRKGRSRSPSNRDKGKRKK